MYMKDMFPFISVPGFKTLNEFKTKIKQGLTFSLV